MQEAHPDQGYTYQRLAEALGDIAGDGLMELRADDDNVHVLICGRPMVHAVRDWLEYMTPRWQASASN
jgi:hypothetical protein